MLDYSFLGHQRPIVSLRSAMRLCFTLTALTISSMHAQASEHGASLAADEIIATVDGVPVWASYLNAVALQDGRKIDRLPKADRKTFKIRTLIDQEITSARARAVGLESDTALAADIQKAEENILISEYALRFMADASISESFAIFQDKRDETILLAQQQGLENDPVVLRRARQKVNKILGEAYLDRAFDQPISEEQVLHAYERLKADHQPVELIKTVYFFGYKAAGAAALSRRFRDGEDFMDVAHEVRRDPSKYSVVRVDESAYISSDSSEYSGDYLRAAFALEVGEVSNIISDAAGWFIISVIDRQFNSRVRPLNEIKDEFVEHMTQQRRDAFRASLWEGVNIQFLGSWSDFTFSGSDQ